MIEEANITMGAKVFFGEYSDYIHKDDDMLIFEKEPTLYEDFAHLSGKGKDYFLFKCSTKEKFIQLSLESAEQLPMVAGKFLVPELIEHIHLTINELKLFSDAFENMDEKHQYEKIIYNSYIENNAFILTDMQRKAAFEVYKMYRTDRYGE